MNQFANNFFKNMIFFLVMGTVIFVWIIWKLLNSVQNISPTFEKTIYICARCRFLSLPKFRQLKWPIVTEFFHDLIVLMSWAQKNQRWSYQGVELKVPTAKLFLSSFFLKLSFHTQSKVDSGLIWFTYNEVIKNQTARLNSIWNDF